MKPLIAWTASVLTLTAWCGRAQPGTTVVLDGHWLPPFAGKPAEMAVMITAEPGRECVLSWEVTVERAVVDRGASNIPPETNGPRRIRLHFALPPVHPHVRLEAALRVVLRDARTHIELGRAERRFPLLGDNPFAGRHREMERRGIVLFDPVGEFSEKLNALGLPFESRRNLASLLEGPPGLLIIAGGLSFKDYGGLPGILQGAAAAGITTLCLAPTEGALPLPIGRPVASSIAQVRLSDRGMAAELDKGRFMDTWGASGPPVAGSMHITDRGGEIAGILTPDDLGWPWVEFQTGRHGAKLIFCGFDILGAWDRTPAARRLLMALIDYAAPSSQPARATHALNFNHSKDTP